MGGHSSADGRAGIAMFENVGRKLNLLVRMGNSSLRRNVRYIDMYIVYGLRHRYICNVDGDPRGAFSLVQSERIVGPWTVALRVYGLLGKGVCSEYSPYAPSG